MVIITLRFFSTNGEFPATILKIVSVYTTPVQTDSISTTLMQTAGIFSTPEQPFRLYALTRTISVIGFSLQQ